MDLAKWGIFQSLLPSATRRGGKFKSATFRQADHQFQSQRRTDCIMVSAHVLASACVLYIATVNALPQYVTQDVKYNPRYYAATPGAPQPIAYQPFQQSPRQPFVVIPAPAPVSPVRSVPSKKPVAPVKAAPAKKPTEVNKKPAQGVKPAAQPVKHQGAHPVKHQTVKAAAKKPVAAPYNRGNTKYRKWKLLYLHSYSFIFFFFFSNFIEPVFLSFNFRVLELILFLERDLSN